jgi:hypothetical protein
MKLKNLEVAEVKPFLRRNLHWRVLDVSISLEPPVMNSEGGAELLGCRRREGKSS